MRALVAATCVAIMLIASPSSAQSTEPTEQRATELKHDGDAALVERRYVDALSAYEQSYALSANPAIHYNRGRALQFLARYPEALEAYERFSQEAPPELRAKAIGLDGIIDELRGKVATVAITVDGTPKRILIGGRDVGLEVLQKPLRVNAGATTIEILSDDYFDVRRDVVLPPRATTNVDVKLTLRHAFGYLVVGSDVKDASVFVDDKRVGLAPVETAVLPGNHPIRVARDGYESATNRVLVTAGEHYDFLMNPTKRAPITSSPWLWGAIGVVVVGVVTTIIVASTQEGNLPTGTFSPGQLRR